MFIVDSNNQAVIFRVRFLFCKIPYEINQIFDVGGRRGEGYVGEGYVCVRVCGEGRREGGGVEERDMPIQRIMRFQAARQYLSLRAWPCPQRHFKDLDASALLCSNLFPRVCWRFRF